MADRTLFILAIIALVYFLAPAVTATILSTFLETSGAVAVVVLIIANSMWMRVNIMRIMLLYRGWAYMPRAYFSQLFLYLLGLLGGRKPKLWSLQPALPPLPVPTLKQSCKQFLRSVKPLLSDAEYAETEKAVNEFQKPGGDGEQLQAMLIQHAKTAKTSWLLEWWENIVYLGGRLPIAIYSNWYGLDRIDPVIRSQIGRGANLIQGLLKFQRMMETQSLPPNRVQNSVPLCMWQYTRIFGSVRIPGEKSDQLEVHPNSKHIIVICNRHLYRLETYHESGGQLSTRDIQTQLQRIIDDAANAQSNDADIAILTSQDRTTWAKQRENLMKLDPQNNDTIRTIETALFNVILEPDSPETVEELAHFGIHNHGRPMWFDKNFNLIFFKNGRLACNIDHTWADASVMVHVFDFVFGTESSADHWVHNRGSTEDKSLPNPTRLLVKITPEVAQQIDVAQATFKELRNSLDLSILKFQYYGKGLIKKLGMSPDAYVQMALQLAFHRFHDSMPLTYESAATFRFHHGRTETVRSASIESAAFVKAMEDPNASATDKLNALKAASKQHVRYMRFATNGDGIDRHLLGLRILAEASGKKPAIFTDKAYNLPWRLSTSQTPATGMLGGGFAPLAADGYGVSYVVAEDRLWFHISSYAAHPATNSKKFGDVLTQALLDIYEVCHADTKLAEVFGSRVYHVLRAE